MYCYSILLIFLIFLMDILAVSYHNIGPFVDQKLSVCFYHHNVLIQWPIGTGKSFLGSALGNQACLAGYKVFYANTNRLFTQIKMAKADGSSIKELNRLEKTDLIILDDFGIQPFDNQSRLILMELIEDRHGKKSTIFTTQVPVTNWYEIIGDETIADAILDRVVHDAHRIELKGDSLRKKGRPKIE